MYPIQNRFFVTKLIFNLFSSVCSSCKTNAILAWSLKGLTVMTIATMLYIAVKM